MQTVLARRELDRHLERLAAGRRRWAETTPGERARLIGRVRRRLLSVAGDQVREGLRAKRLSPGDPAAAEEWFAGVVVSVRTLRLLEETFRALETKGRVGLPPDAVDVLPDGRTVARVFPTRLFERALFPGFEADVWFRRDVDPEDVSRRAAPHERPHGGAVALVLGAGNVASIGLLDAAHKLFVERRVCLLKLNPVNDYLEPFLQHAFAPLIEAGVFAVVRGGAEEGAYLCAHETVSEIHITGSDHTHDAIVFGTGREGEERRRACAPRNTKRITSELGNVSPVIVVPGLWSERELRFHAENVASQLVNNAGFNCNAARVLVLHEGWPQRRRFVDHLRDVLRSIPARYAYYPGAEERQRRFLESHGAAETFGAAAPGALPWTLIPDVDPEARDDICFRTEAFCGVLCETALPAADAGEFLHRAVDFANETLWGTLNACVIVHPRSRNELAGELRHALGCLRYGAIALNHWPALVYGLGSPPWGAYPGAPLDDIQSGRGFVHNTFLLDGVEKCVLSGPFTLPFRPPWFATHGRAHAVSRRMLSLEASPSISRLPSIFLHSLLG